MGVLRVMPVLASRDVDSTAGQLQQLLGLTRASKEGRTALLADGRAVELMVRPTDSSQAPMPDLVVQVDELDQAWNTSRTIGLEVVAEPFASGFDRRFLVRLTDGHVVLVFHGDWPQNGDND